MIGEFLELQYMALAGRVLETLKVVNRCLEDLIHGEHSGEFILKVKRKKNNSLHFSRK